jgi:hypothetical protein
MSVPNILTIPICRTNTAAAKAFLQWLAFSPYAYHIDDPVGEALEEFDLDTRTCMDSRVGEVFHTLGYNVAWECYPWAERERAKDNATELLDGLRWCIKQMQGDSGTGHSHWEGYPEYLNALATLERIRSGDDERTH